MYTEKYGNINNRTSAHGNILYKNYINEELYDIMNKHYTYRTNIHIKISKLCNVPLKIRNSLYIRNSIINKIIGKLEEKIELYI